MTHKYMKILSIVLGIYLLFVGILFVTQRDFIYDPGGVERPDISKAPWMELVEVKTDDDLDLQGWFQQPIGDDRPVIVMFHGNAHNIEGRLFKTSTYLEHRYGLLLAEYRGYGGNPGEPSEEGLYTDGRAYMDWLAREKGIKPERIILYGESLGAAVALQMANEYRVRGLVLEVPFNRATDVGQARFFFVPFLKFVMWDKFDNVSKAQSLGNMPILIGLAGKDTVVPKRFGQNLFDMANEPKTLIVLPEARHNSMYDYEFGDEVIGFIESLEASEKILEEQENK